MRRSPEARVQSGRPPAMTVVPNNSSAVRGDDYWLARAIVNDNDLGFVVVEGKNAFNDAIVVVVAGNDNRQVHGSSYRP